MKERQDDFQTRRTHISHLSDLELKERFLRLAEELVKPLLEVSYNHTTPSIERSVLLRMGFSSIEAKSIVDILFENNLLQHGAGGCIYKLSVDKKRPYLELGRELIDGLHIEYLMEVYRNEA